MTKNNFEFLEPQDKLPESVKNDVMGKIETAKLLLDFWDLFTTKRVLLNQTLIEHANNEITNNKKNEQ